MAMGFRKVVERSEVGIDRARSAPGLGFGRGKGKQKGRVNCPPFYVILYLIFTVIPRVSAMYCATAVVSAMPFITRFM